MSVFDPVEEIDSAVSQLSGVAWVGGLSLVFACWGLGYGVSTWLSGLADASLLALGILGIAVSVPVVLDALIRIGHCQADDESWPAWLLQLASSQPFRPLPVHLIDGGSQPASSAVEQWLEELGDDCVEVQTLAEQWRTAPRGLDTAAAVNLWLLAKLRRRQLNVGLMAG